MTDPEPDLRDSRHNHPFIGRDVVSVTEVPPCPRCDGPGLLTAQVPYGWERAGGKSTSGTTVIVLCPECDRGQPAAGALITFFHVNGRVPSDAVQQCADLIVNWVNSIEVPPLDTEKLDAEVEAWYRNDL